VTDVGSPHGRLPACQIHSGNGTLTVTMNLFAMALKNERRRSRGNVLRRTARNVLQHPDSILRLRVVNTADNGVAENTAMRTLNMAQ
jgi:hypothetical protein